MNRNQRLERIALLSRRLRWAVWVIGVFLVLVTLLIVVGIPGDFAHFQMQNGGLTLGTNLPDSQFSWQARLAVTACFIPSMALIFALLHAANRLLLLYERGEIFSAENARVIHRGGKLIVALAIVGTISNPLAQYIAWKLADASDDISVELRIGLLLVGVAIIVIGHVMSHGAEMADENALTI